MELRPDSAVFARVRFGGQQKRAEDRDEANAISSVVSGAIVLLTGATRDRTHQ